MILWLSWGRWNVVWDAGRIYVLIAWLRHVNENGCFWLCLMWTLKASTRYSHAMAKYFIKLGLFCNFVIKFHIQIWKTEAREHEYVNERMCVSVSNDHTPILQSKIIICRYVICAKWKINENSCVKSFLLLLLLVAGSFVPNHRC